VNCGVVFDLPDTQELGWMAVHSWGGRGVKGIMHDEITRRFRNHFDDLRLVIRPFVAVRVLRAAIDAGKITSIRLIKYEQPRDRAFGSTNTWVRDGEIGKIELNIAPKGFGGRLKPGLIQRFFGANALGARDAIVEFEGLEFDEALVEVEMAPGVHRTFNIDDMSKGFPYSVELVDLEFGSDDDPTDESLRRALEAAISESRPQ
jgi:hypothetical protein